jgi:hypothetical protein
MYKEIEDGPRISVGQVNEDLARVSTAQSKRSDDAISMTMLFQEFVNDSDEK